MNNIFRDYDNEDVENTSDNKNIVYTFNNAIKYLQNELKLFKVRAMEWEIEKTQLKAQICYLLGERKGNSNIRNDLLARIRVLESALTKTKKNDSSLEGMTSVDLKYEVEDLIESELPQYDNYNDNWSQGREILRRYLNEFEYGDKLLHLSNIHSIVDSQNASISTNVLSKEDDTEFPSPNSNERDPCDELLEICDEFEDLALPVDDEISTAESDTTLLCYESPSLLSSVCKEENLDNEQMDLVDSEEEDEAFPMDLDDEKKDLLVNPFRLVTAFLIDDCLLDLVTRGNMNRLIEGGGNVSLNECFLKEIRHANDTFRSSVGDDACKIIVISNKSFIGASSGGVIRLWDNYLTDSESETGITLTDLEILDFTVCDDMIVVLTKKNAILLYSLPQFELMNTILPPTDDSDAYLFIYYEQNRVFLSSNKGKIVRFNPFNYDSMKISSFPDLPDVGDVTALDVDFSLDFVIFGYESGAIRLFTFSEEEDVYLSELTSGTGDGVRSLAFSSSNTLLSLTADGTVSLWDLGDSTPMMTETRIEGAVAVAHVQLENTMADTFVVMCSGGKVVVYDSEAVGTYPFY